MELLPPGQNSVDALAGPFIEQVAPSFFKRSQNDNWPDVVAAFNHRDDMILGATRSGTLVLTVDSVGLDYTCDLPECRTDIWELVSRGDIGSSSFKFIVYEDGWEYADGPGGGMPLRTLLSGKLLDVAPVIEPAYASTSVSPRNVYGSLARAMNAPVEDVEKYWQNGEVRKFFPTTVFDG